MWFALSIWVEAILGIASPVLGDGNTTRFGLLGRGATTVGSPPGSPGPGAHVTQFVVGVLILFLAPWAMRFVVYVDRRMMNLLLGPNSTSSRVRSLEASRAKTLDAATSTLQRIERNLHDGTQAQLVALAMRLGQAKERLENIDVGSEEPADLQAVRRLVDEAHHGAKEAITDLRDLARGIHPPALDIGLENTLATLAARSTIPTDVQVTVHSRPVRPSRRSATSVLPSCCPTWPSMPRLPGRRLAVPNMDPGCASSCATMDAVGPPSTGSVRHRVGWLAWLTGSVRSTVICQLPAPPVARLSSP